MLHFFWVILYKLEAISSKEVKGFVWSRTGAEIHPSEKTIPLPFFHPTGCFACLVTGGGSACFCWQLICLVKPHGELITGEGRHDQISVNGSTQILTSGICFAPTLCVSIARLCFIYCSVCFSLAACISHRTCVVCFICRLAGLVSVVRVFSQAWRVVGCGSSELESSG